MAEDRGDVLKSLGVKRRRKPDEESAEPEPEPKSGLGLGIKRRSGGGAADSGSSGSGLGIKRRSGRAEAAAAPTTDADEAATTNAPAPVWQGKLGNDDTAVMLRNHFKARPLLAGLMPSRVWDLFRTHGRYMGDGQPERKIRVGWEPAYVLYTLPNYPDGAPDVDPKTHKFVFPDGRPAYDEKTRKVLEAGPNRQPSFVEDGFVVGPHLNEVGEWYMYAVWRSDGTPLQIETPEAQAAAKPKPKKDASRSLGLGIKRRS